jgi:Holliday junction resolvasome RuvABC ATP-dependent DNA helicase subunit
MKRKNIDNDTNNNSNKKAKLLESLEDLISYIQNYNTGENKNKLNKILPSLIKLQKLTGMVSVKKTIVGHILYFLMNYEKNQDMIHTVIEGPPGVGKTTLGYILGEIYSNLDIIEQPKNKTNQLKFKIVKRSDLVAKYLGQTSHRTQEVINSVLGGVLFIDEAYSLGNNDVDDSYSKECLDTLNQNLSEKKNQFLCIIAGYKDALERNFFAYNEGLRRRFPFTYTIEEYTPNELKNIFVGMLDNSNWSLKGYKEKKEIIEPNEIQENNKQKIELNIIDNKNNKVVKLKKNDKGKKETIATDDKEKNIISTIDDKEKNIITTIDDKDDKETNVDQLLIFFEKNKQYFPNFGGDIETLIFQSKIEHCKRVFFKDDSEKKILTLEDIINGLEIFKKNKKLNNDIDNKKLLSMYT